MSSGQHGRLYGTDVLTPANRWCRFKAIIVLHLKVDDRLERLPVRHTWVGLAAFGNQCVPTTGTASTVGWIQQ